MKNYTQLTFAVKSKYRSTKLPRRLVIDVGG